MQFSQVSRFSRHIAIRVIFSTAALGAVALVQPISAQTYATNDSTIRRIYDEGMNRSETYSLARA
ncbi:MAG: hypothetical protein ACR2M1_06475, partial [Gemmatimonadaceae bacterium]